MKKIIFVFSLMLIGFTTQSQEVKKNKNAKISFEVDGICGMCKKRIETAALKTKGVKFAIWNVKTHQLNLIMDERKTDVTTVQKNILKVGHDVIGLDKSKLEATEEAYNSVHPCCKYRDEEIILDHEGGLKKQKKQN
ncbi:MAG: heavy-metal-associated domain-containing protein [Polaribacter sp.]